MSYVVDIVWGEAPASYERALALRDELSEARDARLGTGDEDAFEPPSERMAELHRRLTARHPCICDDPDGPWSDGPLINDFGQVIATLGIAFSRVDDVLPFLIETANGMGCWVLDAQDEALHLASGATLRPFDAEAPTESDRRWWQFWK